MFNIFEGLEQSSLLNKNFIRESMAISYHKFNTKGLQFVEDWMEKNQGITVTQIVVDDTPKRQKNPVTGKTVLTKTATFFVGQSGLPLILTFAFEGEGNMSNLEGAVIEAKLKSQVIPIIKSKGKDANWVDVLKTAAEFILKEDAKALKSMRKKSAVEEEETIRKDNATKTQKQKTRDLETTIEDQRAFIQTRQKESEALTQKQQLLEQENDQLDQRISELEGQIQSFQKAA